MRVGSLLLYGESVAAAPLRAYLSLGGDCAHVAVGLTSETMPLFLAASPKADAVSLAAAQVDDVAAAEMLLLHRPRRKTVLTTLLRRFRFSPEVLARLVKLKLDSEHASLLLDQYDLDVATLSRLAATLPASTMAGYLVSVDASVGRDGTVPASHLSDDVVVELLARDLRSFSSQLFTLLACRPSLVAPLLARGSVAAALCAPSPTSFDGAEGFVSEDLLSSPATPRALRDSIFEPLSPARRLDVTPPDCWPEIDLTGPLCRSLVLQLLERAPSLLLVPQLVHLTRNRHLDGDLRLRALRSMSSSYAGDVALVCAGELASEGFPVSKYRAPQDKVRMCPDRTVSVTPAAPRGYYRHSDRAEAAGSLRVDVALRGRQESVYRCLRRRLGDNESAWLAAFTLLDNLGANSALTIDDIADAALGAA